MNKQNKTITGSTINVKANHSKMLNKVIITENAINGRQITVIIEQSLTNELDEIKYFGGFLRFNYDIIEEVEGKRQSSQELGKLKAFLTQIF